MHANSSAWDFYTMINNSIQYKYSDSYPGRTRFKGRDRENEFTAHTGQKTLGTSVYESDKINVNTSATKTTAGLNPSGRLSFKGSNTYVSKYASKTAEELKHTFAGKLVQNRAFNWFIDQTAGNTLITEALVALGLTALLRPIAIAALPAKDESDKMKNRYQIGQAISTGLVGLGLTFLVSEPIKRSFTRLTENPQNFLKKNLDLTSKNVHPEVKRALKETTIRLVQPVFLPLKAALTIMMIPPILGALGIKKNKPNPADVITPAQKASVDYSFMSFKGDNENKKIFQNFAGNATKINKPQESPSFKANLNSLLKADIAEKGKRWNQKTANVVYDTIATLMGKVIDTKQYKNFINWFKDTNFMPHLIAGESIWLTGFYANETRKSKSIEQEQKLPLILNQVITTALCTAGAYLLDGKIKNKMTDLQVVYKKLNPNAPKKITESKLTGIKLLAPVVIFTVIYRFIGPVIVTPIANLVSNKIQNNNKNKN